MIAPQTLTEFFCGPLQVRLSAESEFLLARLSTTFATYDVRWEPPFHRVHVCIHEVDTPAPMTACRFLRCSRMAVNTEGDGLFATSESGASALLVRESGVDRWAIRVPRSLRDFEELEDFVVLVLTVGWRHLGWIPLHAAALMRKNRCVLICAASGGGKSTLTAALIRSGWRALSDDKLLLRVVNSTPEVFAVLHSLNLHPRTHQWFPEVGDLWALPAYSGWTEKRKLSMKAIWPNGTARQGTLTHVVLLERHDGAPATITEGLSRAEIFEIVLRQTVIPGEREEATRMLRAIAQLAGCTIGLRLSIANDAFGGDSWIDPLERSLI